MTDNTPLVVFSHLRWNFVYQRPQHLLSQLAAKFPVYYIEEPVVDVVNAPHWSFHKPAPGVVVCQPHSPRPQPGFCAMQLPIVRGLLDDLIAEQALTGAIAWLYTPLALPLVD